MKYFIQRQKYSAFLWTLKENIPMEGFFLKKVDDPEETEISNNQHKILVHIYCLLIYSALCQVDL